eukprot:6571399-Prymnesium_polylepis.1
MVSPALNAASAKAVAPPAPYPSVECTSATELWTRGGWRDDWHLRAPCHPRCQQRRTRACCADNCAHALSVEGIAGQVQRGCQALGRVTFAVAIGNAQPRARQQVVGHTVGLVVDLANRLERTHARRPRQLCVACRLRVEHRQEQSQSHLRHRCRGRLRRLAVVRRRVRQPHARRRLPPL